MPNASVRAAATGLPSRRRVLGGILTASAASAAAVVPVAASAATTAPPDDAELLGLVRAYREAQAEMDAANLADDFDADDMADLNDRRDDLFGKLRDCPARTHAGAVEKAVVLSDYLADSLFGHDDGLGSDVVRSIRSLAVDFHVLGQGALA